jgi:hypothetical protein
LNDRIDRTCLSEQSVLEFVAGEVAKDPRRVAQIEAHLARCAPCLSLVDLASKAMSAPPSNDTPRRPRRADQLVRVAFMLARSPLGAELARRVSRPQDFAKSVYDCADALLVEGARRRRRERELLGPEPPGPDTLRRPAQAAPESGGGDAS